MPDEGNEREYLPEALGRLLDQRLTQTTLGPDPAAGAEFVVTVPGGEYWELHSVVVQLVTSAVVANRRLVFVIDDGTLIFLRTTTGQDQTANTTINYTFAAFGARGNDFGVNEAAGHIPALILLSPGSRIRSITTLLDINDNYGPPAVRARRFSPGQLALTTADIEREVHATLGLNRETR